MIISYECQMHYDTKNVIVSKEIWYEACINLNPKPDFRHLNSCERESINSILGVFLQNGTVFAPAGTLTTKQFQQSITKLRPFKNLNNPNLDKIVEFLWITQVYG